MLTSDPARAATLGAEQASPSPPLAKVRVLPRDRFQSRLYCGGGCYSLKHFRELDREGGKSEKSRQMLAASMTR